MQGVVQRPRNVGSPSVGLMRESSQATVYTETAHVTLGENCNAVVIDRSAGSVKCHVSGKRKRSSVRRGN